MRSIYTRAMAASILSQIKPIGHVSKSVPTCNLSPEEIAERDRPISRQERRQMERLKKKGRDQ